MVRIRPPQYGPDLALEHALVGFRFLHELLQGFLAHHREERVPDCLIRVFDRCFGQPEEQLCLAPHPLEIVSEFLLDLLHRTGIDLQHQNQEQIDQAVRDPHCSLMTQRRQQG